MPFFFLTPLLLTLLWAEPAHAYAWMIKHSYGGCPTCHIDPSGGELLTQYGRVQGDLLLSMQWGSNEDSAAASDTEADGGSDFDSFGDFDFDDTESSEGAESFDDTGTDDLSGEEASDDAGDEPKGKEAGGKSAGEEAGPGFLWGLLPPSGGFTLGGAYRNLYIYNVDAGDFTLIPIMMGDLYFHLRSSYFRSGVSIGIAKVRAGSAHARAAQVTRGQEDQINMISRTHWIGFDIGDEYTLRLGRINMPFGVRIPEHTMWVREATRTDRESDQQHGVSLSYAGDNFRGEIQAIAGNYQINPDKFRERGYSLYAEYLPTDSMAIGVSSLVTHVKRDRVLLADDVLRQAHGLMTRMKILDEVSLLAEVDGLITTGSQPGYVGFAQLDYELVQGLHAMVTGEVLDGGIPDGATETAIGAGQPRLGVWGTIDWYFYNQFEFRVDVQKRQESSTTIFGQLHLFL